MKIKSLAISLLCLGLAGCGDVDLKPFFGQVLQFKTGDAQKLTNQSVQVSSAVKFTHTRYFPNYRTECDSEVCGYNISEDCTPITRCTGGSQECTPIERCTSAGCHTDQVCRSSPPDCSTDYVCRTVSTPRYCDVNCREVPFQDSVSTDTLSPVTLTVSGSSDILDNIKQLELGVKGNSELARLIQNPQQRPKDSAPLFESLSASDKSVMVLRAKGLRLVRGQNFLSLPAHFKRGDSIKIDLQVESAGVKDEILSSVGSETDLPDLQTSE